MMTNTSCAFQSNADRRNHELRQEFAVMQAEAGQHYEVNFGRWGLLGDCRIYFENPFAFANRICYTAF